VSEAIVVLTMLIVAEFTFAPINLWTGRTMDNYRRFTGLSPRLATRILAPAKLATAFALLGGFAYAQLGVAGSIAAVTISGFYLVRLAHPERQDPAGIAAFIIFGSLGAALRVLYTVV